MEKNKKLARYDFKYNNITDRGKTSTITKRFFRPLVDHNCACGPGKRLARRAVRHPTTDLRKRDLRCLRRLVESKPEKQQEKKGRQEKEKEDVRIIFS